MYASAVIPNSPRRRVSLRGVVVATLCAGLGLLPEPPLFADAPPTTAAAMPAPVPPPEAKPYIPPENPAELLRLDDEIVKFFAEHVTGHRHDGFVLQRIIAAIVSPSGLNFAYDDQATFHVRETFRQRRGNCLTFAMLVVAVAREYQFEAAFQSVDIPERWDRYGTNIATIQHVNVRVETEEGPFIVDLRPDLVPHLETYPTRLVSDESVFANFYSDVGFFALVHGRDAEAMHAMVYATVVDPRSASAWSNLATLHSRQGNFAAARDCFARAYKLDSWATGGLVGYVNVLHRLGSPEDLQLAHKLERRAQKLRDRNPYYHEYLAQTARQREDWAAAESSLRRAIALKDDDPEFYAQLITTLQNLGRADDAQRIGRKLERLQRDAKLRSPHLVP